MRYFQDLDLSLSQDQGDIWRKVVDVAVEEFLMSFQKLRGVFLIACVTLLFVPQGFFAFLGKSF